MSDARRQPAAWAIVLDQIRTWEDAAALLALFEYRDTTLFANATPIDALNSGVAALGERALSAFLAEHLAALDGEPWVYTDLYSPTRGRDVPGDHVEAFVARCAAAGAMLEARPPPPPPWTVVRAQIRSPQDAAVVHWIAQQPGACANHWPPEPEDVTDLAPGPVSAEQVRELVGRCSAAGVELDWEGLT